MDKILPPNHRLKLLVLHPQGPEKTAPPKEVAEKPRGEARHVRIFSQHFPMFLTWNWGILMYSCIPWFCWLLAWARPTFSEKRKQVRAQTLSDTITSYHFNHYSKWVSVVRPENLVVLAGLPKLLRSRKRHLERAAGPLPLKVKNGPYLPWCISRGFGCRLHASFLWGNNFFRSPNQSANKNVNLYAVSGHRARASALAGVGGKLSIHVGKPGNW